MTDEPMPDDLAGLDARIGEDMLTAALLGVMDAEQYTRERAAHIAEHGEADAESFPKWSEISEPGTVEYGPYCPPPTPDPPPDA